VLLISHGVAFECLIQLSSMTFPLITEKDIDSILLGKIFFEVTYPLRFGASGAGSLIAVAMAAGLSKLIPKPRVKFPSKLFQRKILECF
jgi:hypothetical protein